MPKSRHKRVLYCPGCGASCHSGKARLERHRKNQCKESKQKFQQK